MRTVDGGTSQLLDRKSLGKIGTHCILGIGHCIHRITAQMHTILAQRKKIRPNKVYRRGAPGKLEEIFIRSRALGELDEKLCKV